MDSRFVDLENTGERATLTFTIIHLATYGAFYYCCHTGLSSLQDPLVRPTVSVELHSAVSSELLQGLGEIVAEDTNNVMVQVVIILYFT